MAKTPARFTVVSARVHFEHSAIRAVQPRDHDDRIASPQAAECTCVLRAMDCQRSPGAGFTFSSEE